METQNIGGGLPLQGIEGQSGGKEKKTVNRNTKANKLDNYRER